MSRRFIPFYALVFLLGVSAAAFAASPASEKVRSEIQKLNGALVQMVQGQESGNAAAASSLLQARHGLLAQLIKEDPLSVRSVGLAPDAVERLRGRLTGVEAFIEQEGEWTGSLEIIAEMDFEHHTSTTHRFIRSANGRLELFGGPCTFGRTDRMGGTQMRVKGIRSEALIAVDSITTASAPAPLAPVGVQNYAVLVVTSPANPTFPRGWDISSIQNIFFGTSGSTLNTFWQEASYGLTRISHAE